MVSKSEPGSGSSPLLSIVVPVYGVQEFLNECIASIMTQGARDIEVIAVDDASPDYCGDILDELARQHPNLSVIHLADNVGLGPARNLGFAQARGEYVLFLDSDDAMTAGSIEAIRRQIASRGRPDMLIVDHARTYWWGEVRRNVKHRVMVELSDAPFRASENPEVLEFLQVAWNKVCRRDFLLREGLFFPTGFYEDTLWTHAAYFTARSIVTLPTVCVLYRQRRTGSILNSPSARHLEALSQWEATLEFVDGRPELSPWREKILGRMVYNYLTILKHPRRLHREDRSTFVRMAGEQLRRHGARVPYDAKSAGDVRRQKLLIRGDGAAFIAYAALERCARRGKKSLQVARKHRKQMARQTKTAIKRQEYRAWMKSALDPKLVVFASLWNRGIAGNPGAIYRAMQSLAPELHGVWVVRKDCIASVPEGIDAVIPGSRRYWRIMATATFFVNDVNFPDDVVKRPGQVHVQTQHGTPLKHMGLDLMAHPAASRGMSFDMLLARSDRWDYNISSNRFSTLVWAKAFPSRFRSLESGYPRNDVLINTTQEEIREIRTELGIPAGKTVVLFAPTHRDHDKHFILRADLRTLSEQLGPDFVVLARAHYYYRWMPDLDQLESEGLIRNVSRHPSVERLMQASDMLVTDYSSIMFDFAALDRPVVLFAPDWKTYCDVRGVYFDIFETSPGVSVRTQEEVVSVLRDGRADDAAARAARAAFRERFNHLDDGRAAERVVRTTLLGEPLLPFTPIADVPLPPRPASVRYELRPMSRELLSRPVDEDF